MVLCYNFRNKKAAKEDPNYSCPVLEELYLQDNRLDRIPDALFRLPSLVTLVLSNNKLQQLPYNMWQAPKLRELNAGFNLLKELPSSPLDVSVINIKTSVKLATTHMPSSSFKFCLNWFCDFRDHYMFPDFTHPVYVSSIRNKPFAIR